MAKLGKSAGTSAQQIERLEKGQRPLSKKWAEKIAPHIGLTAQDLMFPEGAPELPKDFAELEYDAKKAAIVAFLTELVGDKYLDWHEILEDVEEVALPLATEPEDRPNIDRVKTQARAIAVVAKRKLRRKTDPS